MITRFVAVLLLFLVSTASAVAQTYPSRPVKFVVPFAPGGGTDLVARIIGQKMGEGLGQPVVIENRGGAGGQIGTAFAAKSAPDGYTIVIGSTPLTIGHSLYKNLPYDILTDFAPVSLVVMQPLLLAVHPSVPAKNLRELVALAKAQPGKLNYSSGGSGTGTYLAAELFKSMAGIDVVHVPYTGQAAALNAVLGNQITMLFDQPGTALGHIKGGKLRALAVSSRVRSPQLPDIPTMDEAGVSGYVVDSWFGVFAPAGTPKAIVERLSAEIAKATQFPEVRDKLLAAGFAVVGGTPAQFDDFVRAEVAKWKRVIDVSGAKAE
ncbi:MAG: tripartite tricarboxylate transporter substrate binding protein [Betaproteobacteria bacterium]|nr:tripartite tricarboxylate transporter substrate binding protein [Betaproteobacteria bacterium]